MAILLILIGVILYAIGEGVTEALTWEYAQFKIKADPSKYHFWRLIEMVGIGVMLYAMSMIATTTLQNIGIAFGILLVAFFFYRLAFITIRGQDKICPNWLYDIKIFGKVYNIKYPPEWTAYCGLLVGLFTLIIAMSR